MAYNSERLQLPFSDIIGANSTEQKLVSLLWDMFKNTPLPDNDSLISKQAAKNIMLHLLCTVNSVGLINVAGYHSSAITLLRSIEDALDCFSAVASNEEQAEKWLNSNLKASDAAKNWTTGKTLDDSMPMSEYRKSIRDGLNNYSHCSPAQTSWNMYREPLKDGTCTIKLNYNRAVIRSNGYYIDRYLCIHIYELCDVVLECFSNYLSKNIHIKNGLKDLMKSIEQEITDFLNEIESDKLYMDTPPELTGLLEK